MDLVIPDKPYFRIREVSELLDVKPYVLRYWEGEFPIVRPAKSSKGQRVYSRRDVENLVRIHGLLRTEGFTLAGAKKQMQKGMSAESPAVSEEPSEEPSGHSCLQESLRTIACEIEAFLACELSEETTLWT